MIDSKGKQKSLEVVLDNTGTGNTNDASANATPTRNTGRRIVDAVSPAAAITMSFLAQMREALHVEERSQAAEVMQLIPTSNRPIYRETAETRPLDQVAHAILDASTKH